MTALFRLILIIVEKINHLSIQVSIPTSWMLFMYLPGSDKESLCWVRGQKKSHSTILCQILNPLNLAWTLLDWKAAKHIKWDDDNIWGQND